MNFNQTLLLIIISTTQIVSCTENEAPSNQPNNSALVTPWWESVSPIIIDGDEFYGRACSVSRISHTAGTKSEKILFEVPSRLLTYCSTNKPNKNYLKYDGDYIILCVDRQTMGAGSRTGERYRSADFVNWEEYIGVTWVDGEEYEAWRKLGSTSSKADSVKKVESNGVCE